MRLPESLRAFGTADFESALDRELKARQSELPLEGAARTREGWPELKGIAVLRAVEQADAVEVDVQAEITLVHAR